MTGGTLRECLCVIPAKAGIQSLSPCATRWCWGLGRPGVLGHSSGFPLKTAGMTGGEPAGKTGGNGGNDRRDTAGMLVCHSRESGNPESFPLRHALVLGAWPAGRPGPFLWIPAKNCGKDRGETAGMTGGNGGNDCMSFPRKRESRVFSPAQRVGAGGLAGRASWAIPLDSR